MSADQYIDKAIERGITYRRQYMASGEWKITFTHATTGQSVHATNSNQADAAEEAYIGITKIA